MELDDCPEARAVDVRNFREVQSDFLPALLQEAADLLLHQQIPLPNVILPFRSNITTSSAERSSICMLPKLTVSLTQPAARSAWLAGNSEFRGGGTCPVRSCATIRHAPLMKRRLGARGKRGGWHRVMGVIPTMNGSGALSAATD